jgi:hypothetical protein
MQILAAVAVAVERLLFITSLHLLELTTLLQSALQVMAVLEILLQTQREPLVEI